MLYYYWYLHGYVVVPGCIVPLSHCSLICLAERIAVTSAVHERGPTDCSRSVRACRTSHLATKESPTRER